MSAPRDKRLTYIQFSKPPMLEQADLAGDEVYAAGSRRAGPYGVASQAK